MLSSQVLKVLASLSLVATAGLTAGVAHAQPQAATAAVKAQAGAPGAAKALEKAADKAAVGLEKAADKAAIALEKASDKAANGLEKAGDKAANALDKAHKPEHADDKAGGKPDDAGDKANANANANDGHAKADEARKARRKSQREALRGQVKAILKGKPMDVALKQQLEHHARRVARLERIKALATEAGDKPAEERATKLLEKENERHAKWLAGYEKNPARAEADASANVAVGEKNPSDEKKAAADEKKGEAK